MLVLVMYDITTKDDAGKRRIRKVERICLNWGIPVQESVFECEIDAQQYCKMYQEMKEVINEEKDSIRFYLLGNHYHSKRVLIGRQMDEWNRQHFII